MAPIGGNLLDPSDDYSLSNERSFRNDVGRSVSEIEDRIVALERMSSSAVSRSMFKRSLLIGTPGIVTFRYQLDLGGTLGNSSLRMVREWFQISP